jgi:hypothetical protein
MSLYDNTAASLVSGLSLTLANGTPYNYLTVSPSVILPVNHQYTVQIVGGTGCSTTPNNPDFTISYTFRNPNLQAVNNLSDVSSASTARTNIGAAASNASMTVNGVSCALGSTCTISLSTLGGTTSSIGGSSLTAGQAATGTVTITGATTAMACVASAAGGTSVGTGFIPSCQITATNTATVSVTAVIAGTPTATTYIVRVIQ